MGWLRLLVYGIAPDFVDDERARSEMRTGVRSGLAASRFSRFLVVLHHVRTHVVKRVRVGRGHCNP